LQETHPLSIIRRLRKRQLVFTILFLIGTIVAATGWFAEWEQLRDVLDLFEYASIIILAGHVLQVIGAFGSLLTPDYVEEEEGAEL
jgi:hypothetical protein